MRAQSLSHVQLCDPWTVARQASLSMGFFQARILKWVVLMVSQLPSCRQCYNWALCTPRLCSLAHPAPDNGTHTALGSAVFHLTCQKHFFPVFL